jgi:hypothetical protein
LKIIPSLPAILLVFNLNAAEASPAPNSKDPYCAALQQYGPQHWRTLSELDARFHGTPNFYILSGQNRIDALEPLIEKLAIEAVKTARKVDEFIHIDTAKDNLRRGWTSKLRMFDPKDDLGKAVDIIRELSAHGISAHAAAQACTKPEP